MTRLCNVNGCNKSHHAFGLCKKHLYRFKKHGDPNALLNREKGTGYIGQYLKIMKNRISKDEHVWIAEKALGKPLPKNAHVHHVDRNKLNNTPSNLVVCPDNAYHAVIEKRGRAYDACGHADWLKCSVCQQYDDPKNMFVNKPVQWHRECKNNYYKKLRKSNHTGGTI